MLVLTRGLGEKILIGDGITLTVTRIGTAQVRIGIDAPREILIRRAELVEQWRDESTFVSRGSEECGA
jgi:carbon storage regulator